MIIMEIRNIMMTIIITTIRIIAPSTSNEHLWRRILPGARHRQGATLHELMRGVEICQPKTALVFRHQDVVAFHVAMQHSLTMQIVHCLEEHPEELFGHNFTHRAALHSQCEVLSIVIGQHQARAQSCSKAMHV